MPHLLGDDTIERRLRRTLAKALEDGSSVPVAVGILVADVRAPRSDHGQNESPTFREQNPIDIRIVRADLLRQVRNIELDRSTAAGFEIDEQQAVTGAEDVAGMRLTVQQLVDGAASRRASATSSAESS